MEIEPHDGAGRFGRWKLGIERRIAALERAKRLTSASFVGRTRILDDDGNTIGQLGTIGVNDASGRSEETGISIQSGGEFVYLATDERGMVLPAPQIEWRRIQDAVPVTATTYTSIWQSIPLFFTSDAIWVSAALQSPDPGTDGEARLQLIPQSGPAVVSGAQYIPSGFNSYRTWRWDLRSAAGIAPGERQNAFLNLQVRKIGGPGTIHTYEPLPMLIQDRGTLEATPTGV